MTFVTVANMTEDLWESADILRGSIDSSEYLGIVSRMLILKRASDQPGFLRVPDRAQWSHIVMYSGRELGHVLDEALRQLEHANPELLDSVLEGGNFSRSLEPAELRALVDYFSDIRLDDGHLEFRDTIGYAYNHILDRFADRGGKRGGEFYTPASVTELMVRLVKPHEGQSVYDPFVGSGSMLVRAKQYVEEHCEADANLALFGQEKVFSTFSIARLNLLLNGVTDGSILCGDTLERPMHTVGDGRLRLFDRVLTNPPFSMTYNKSGLRYPERMRYGWTPKQADLMNVQHVLSVLRPDGVGAVVTPHGVLFRGGAEAEIRRGILEDGRIEAVIGIGANVFYGTAIPACILVLRGKNGLPEDRRGSVLFINAEREAASGRTRNRLEPAHVEKIVHTYRARPGIPGFSRIVSLHEIAQNDFDLNIRRYVDTSPPFVAPLDVRGTLFGGIPRQEAQAEESRFQDFGINLIDLFQIRNSDYLDFLPEGYKVTAERIQELSAPYGQRLLDRLRNWWQRTETRITELAGTGRLIMLRSDFMDSFSADLLAQGVLDQYQLRGVFADWWSDRHDDFRSLDLRGFDGVIDRWATARRPSVSRGQDRSAHDLVLDALGDDLRSRIEKLVFLERQELADTYRSWGERYATSLADLEEQREVVASRLKARIQELGYADYSNLSSRLVIICRPIGHDETIPTGCRDR